MTSRVSITSLRRESELDKLSEQGQSPSLMQETEPERMGLLRTLTPGLIPRMALSNSAATSLGHERGLS
jgi:hypothetical protein